MGFTWPVVGMLLSAGGSLYLLRYLWPYRDEPGAYLWVGVVGCMALWSLAYGVALLVFDPGLRKLFEVPIWLAFVWIGPLFLGFALRYTGRGSLLQTWWFGALLVAEGAVSIGVVTNGLHHLVWSDYALVPVFGAATVTYARQPLATLQLVVTFFCTTTGILLLFDTVLSYGPLYRKQAVAIALSPVPPAAASLVWLFRVGPYPQLNLVPLAFLPHLALDVYALFGRDMFELPPATRRVGERAAIDDLPSPVVVVDREARVIDLNDAAASLFGVSKADVLAAPLASLLGRAVDLDDEPEAVTLRPRGVRREFEVDARPFGTSGGGGAGYTVVLQDVTEATQRKQRLAVLNRILRHNLRTDLGVASAYADELVRLGTEDRQVELAENVGDIGRELVDLADKTREATAALDEGGQRRSLAFADVLDDIADDLRKRFPAGTVAVDVPAALEVRADERLVRLVFGNAIENGLEHGGDEPHVGVTTEPGPDSHSMRVHVMDDGPGLPEHERRVVQGDEESALEHSSGLGLWLIRWGTTAMGGDVAFATDEGGTTVSVRLPDVVTGSGPE